MPFAFHKRCGSPQWWWLHKSSNTCRLSDLWETSKSYLLNCNESRLCLWLSRQRVQFPDPLVMRYDIRLSYHRDFTLFPKIALVQWWNNFQNIPRSFGWRPWQVLLRASGPKITVFPPTARRWNQKTNRCFRSKLSLEVQSDELSTPVLLCINSFSTTIFLILSRRLGDFFQPTNGQRYVKAPGTAKRTPFFPHQMHIWWKW